MDNDKSTTRQQVIAALLAAVPRPQPGSRPEFVAYLNSLNAMDLHVARYLLHDLNIPSQYLPALVPLIDDRCFEARLESQISDVLTELEK
jgi:hypothetical protein